DGSSSATSMRSVAKTKRPSPAIVVCWRSSTARRTTSTRSTRNGSKTTSPSSIRRRPPEPPHTIAFADGSSHVGLADHDQQTHTAPSNNAVGLTAAWLIAAKRLESVGEAGPFIDVLQQVLDAHARQAGANGGAQLTQHPRD